MTEKRFDLSDSSVDGSEPPNIAEAEESRQKNRFILPAEFWEVSPELRQIRQASLARQVSPDVVLHAVLAIITSLLDHRVRVHTGKGLSVLSYYVAAIGDSGSGKTEGLDCAHELLDEWVSKQRVKIGDENYINLPLGSGEGMVEAFMGTESVNKLDAFGNPVLDKNNNPVTKDIRVQVRHNALFHTDEGRMLLSIDARKGATIMSVLCEMWSGKATGQTNAEAARTRKIEDYVVGLLVGFQPGKIHELFGDTAGGAPQRFAYAWAMHPDITADDVPWPGGLTPDVPDDALVITLPAPLRREVREHQARRVRGESKDGPLDGHRMLLTCRTATLLALLHGETEVSDWYWRLAHTVVETSCRLRDDLAQQIVREARAQAREREKSAIRVQATAQVTAVNRLRSDNRARDAADRIVSAVEKAGGELSYGRAKNALRHNIRDVADEAIKLAISDGRLMADEKEGGESGGRRHFGILRTVRAEEDGE